MFLCLCPSRCWRCKNTTPHLPECSYWSQEYQALLSPYLDELKKRLVKPYYCKTTSDSASSEIGTQYNRPLYKGHCLRPQNCFPYTSDTFWTSKRGQSLYKGQNGWIYIVPNLFGGSCAVATIKGSQLTEYLKSKKKYNICYLCNC